MNGYDEDKGRFLVPFDLKKDVIEPLHRVEEGLSDMSVKLTEHLSNVSTAVHDRMMPIATYVEEMQAKDARRAKRNAKLRKIAAWGAGPLGALILAIAGRIAGYSV